MDHSESSNALLKELAAIKVELARLEKRNAELEAALDEIAHDSRRCNDALERAGWRSGNAEARDAMLTENRRLIETDLEKNQASYVKMTRRLEQIQKHLNRKQ
jgi:chromosome segregation ATPase